MAKQNGSGRAARPKVEEHDADLEGVDDHDVEEPAESKPDAPPRAAVPGAPVEYQKGSGWFGIVLLLLFVLGITASMLID